MPKQTLNEIEALIRQNEDSLQKLKALASRLRGQLEDSNREARRSLQDSKRGRKDQPKSRE